MKEFKDKKKVLIPCRFSFLHCWEPDSVNGSEPKYSVSAIIPKSDTKTVNRIKAAIEVAKQESLAKWGGKIPPNLKMPLRDGDIDRPDTPKYRLPIDDNEIIHYETKRVFHYTNLKETLKAISPDKTGLLYAAHIKTMKQLEQTARESGFNPVCVWSISNADHEMSQEQLDVREQVLKHYTIPPEYNLLIINSSSETSLKIKSPVDFAIVHSLDEDTQVQVRGRINNDLSCLYLPATDSTIVNVPDHFLDCQLFTAEKQKLCEVLNLRNESRRLCGWTTVKRRIIASGYEVTEGRKGNYRFSVIHAPE